MGRARLPQETLQALRSHFRKNLECDQRERGACVDTDGNIFPFGNVSRTPEVTIEQDPVDFRIMARLFAEDRLAAVAHSHPKWAARPSMADVEGHRLSCDMVIYSCRDDEFSQFAAGEVKNYYHLL